MCGMRTSGLLCVPFMSDVPGSVCLSFTYFVGTGCYSDGRVSLRFDVIAGVEEKGASRVGQLA
jgi:hypothetical protein